MWLAPIQPRSEQEWGIHMFRRLLTWWGLVFAVVGSVDNAEAGTCTIQDWELENLPMANEMVINQGRQDVPIGWTLATDCGEEWRVTQIKLVNRRLGGPFFIILAHDEDGIDPPYVWPEVNRHPIEGVDGEIWYRLQATIKSASETMVVNSDDFWILDAQFDAPSSGSDFAPGDEVVFQWSEGGRSDDEIRLAVSGTQGECVSSILPGDSEGSTVTLACDPGEYATALTYTSPGFEFDVEGPTITVVPECSVEMSGPPAGDPIVENCSANLSDHELLAFTLSNSGDEQTLSEMTLDATSNGEALLPGRIRWSSDGGMSWSASEQIVEGDVTFSSMNVPIGGSGSTTIQVQSTQMGNPDQGTASVRLSVDTSGLVLETSDCALSGDTVEGVVLRLTGRYASPTSYWPEDQPGASTVWCDGDSQESTALTFGLGEAGEWEYEVTSIDLTDEDSGRLDLIKEVQVRRSGTTTVVLRDSTPTDGIQCTGSLTVGRSVDESANEFDVVILWKTEHLAMEEDESSYRFEITSIGTNPASYCNSEPFDSILHVPGSQLRRLRGAVLQVANLSDDVEVCGRKATPSEFTLIQFDLVSDSNAHESATLSSLELNVPMNYFQNLNINNVAVPPDGGVIDLVDSGVTITVPVGGSAQVTVTGRANSSILEGPQSIQLANILYYGVDSGDDSDCHPVPNTAMSQWTYHFSPVVSLSVGGSAVVLCDDVVNESHVLQVGVTAEDYGSNVPKLASLRFDGLAGSTYSRNSARLENGHGEVVGPPNAQGQFLGLDWTLPVTAKLSYDVDHVDGAEVSVALVDGEVVDPDSCDLLGDSFVVDDVTGTVGREIRTQLALEVLADPSESNELCTPSSPTTVLMTQIRLKSSMETSNYEAAVIDKMVLGLNSGVLSSVVNAFVMSGSTTYDSIWNPGTGVIEFRGNQPQVPASASQNLTLELYCTFDPDANLADAPFQIRIDSVVARGTQTYQLCSVALDSPPPATEAEGQELSFYSPEVVHVEVANEEPMQPGVNAPVQLAAVTLPAVAADTYLTSVVVGECEGGEYDLRDYLGSPEVRIGPTRVDADGAVGEDSIVMVLDPPVSLDTESVVEVWAQTKSWTDMDNLPPLQVAPESLSGTSAGDCSASFDLGTAECWTVDLNLPGTILVQEVNPGDEDTLFCAVPNKVLGFKLTPTPEEGGTLGTVVVDLGPEDVCEGCIAGTAMLVRDRDGDGEEDPGEVVATIELSDTLHFTGLEESLWRSVASSWWVVLDADLDSEASGQLSPAVTALAVVGDESGDPMAANRPNTWTSRVRVVGSKIGRVHYDAGAPEEGSPLFLGALDGNQNALQLSMDALGWCAEDATPVTCRVSLTPSFNVDEVPSRDVEAVRLYLNQDADPVIALSVPNDAPDEVAGDFEVGLDQLKTLQMRVEIEPSQTARSGNREKITVSFEPPSGLEMSRTQLDSYVQWTRDFTSTLVCREGEDLIVPLDTQGEILLHEAELRASSIGDRVVGLSEAEYGINGSDLGEAFGRVTLQILDAGGNVIEAVTSQSLTGDSVKFAPAGSGHLSSGRSVIRLRVLGEPSAAPVASSFQLDLKTDNLTLNPLAVWSGNAECQGGRVSFVAAQSVDVSFCGNPADEVHWSPAEELAIARVYLEPSGDDVEISELRFPVRDRQVLTDSQESSRDFEVWLLGADCETEEARVLAVEITLPSNSNTLYVQMTKPLPLSSKGEHLEIRGTAKSRNGLENSQLAFGLEAPEVDYRDTQVNAEGTITPNVDGVWAEIRPWVPAQMSVDRVRCGESTGFPTDADGVRLFDVILEFDKEPVHPVEVKLPWSTTDLLDEDDLRVWIEDQDDHVVADTIAVPREELTGDLIFTVFPRGEVGRGTTTWSVYMRSVMDSIAAGDQLLTFREILSQDVPSVFQFQGTLTGIAPTTPNQGRIDQCNYTLPASKRVQLSWASEDGALIAPGDDLQRVARFDLEVLGGAEGTESINTIEMSVKNRLAVRGATFWLRNQTGGQLEGEVTQDGGSLRVRFENGFLPGMRFTETDPSETLELWMSCLGAVAGEQLMLAATGLEADDDSRDLTAELTQSEIPIVLVAGVCDSNASTMVVSDPANIRPGVSFDVVIELRDGRGVDIGEVGNALQGVQSTDFDWSGLSGLAAVTNDLGTDQDGRIRFSLTWVGSLQSGAPVPIVVVDGCEIGLDFAGNRWIAGLPNAEESSSSVVSANPTEVVVGLDLRDSWGNPLHWDDFAATLAIPDPDIDEIVPLGSGVWRIMRSANLFGWVQATVTSGCIGCEDDEPISVRIRLPELNAPSFVTPVPATSITADSLRVAIGVTDDNLNVGEVDGLVLQVVMRGGWSQAVQVFDVEGSGAPDTGRQFEFGIPIPSASSLEYALRVRDFDGNVSRIPEQEGMFFVHQTTVSDSRDFIGPQINGWRFVSVPDVLSSRSVKDVFRASRDAYGDPDKDEWGVAYFRGDGFDYYGKEGDRLSEIKAGYGYWVKKVKEAESAPLRVALSRTTQATSNPLEVRARGGTGAFTAIGCPFSTPLSASDLKRAEYKAEDQWTQVFDSASGTWVEGLVLYKLNSSSGWDNFSGSGLESWSIGPWEGQYLTLPDGATDFRWIPEPLDFARPGATTGNEQGHPARPRDSEWVVSVRVHAEGAQEAHVFAAAAYLDGGPGVDVHDVIAPPSPGGGGFVSSIPYRGGSLDLLGESRITSSEVEVFSPVLTLSKPAEWVTLDWPTVDLPEGWTATAVSLVDGSTASLGDPTRFRMGSGGKVLPIRLVVGREDEVGRELENAVAGASELLMLAPSPTPFSDQTTVWFSLPTPTAVDLQVISVGGRVVSRLIEGAVLEAGAHRVEWTGVDRQGRRLPAGVYWLRLDAAGDSRLAKAVIVR